MRARKTAEPVFDHEFTRQIICPRCGHAHPLDWYLGPNQTGRTPDTVHGRLFRWRRDIFYSTAAIDPTSPAAAHVVEGEPSADG